MTQLRGYAFMNHSLSPKRVEREEGAEAVAQSVVVCRERVVPEQYEARQEFRRRHPIDDK